MTTFIKVVERTKVFVGPSAANVRADVAAGPRNKRHWRHYGRWRLVTWPSAEIGSMGWRTGQERDAGDAGQQEILHLVRPGERIEAEQALLSDHGIRLKRMGASRP